MSAREADAGTRQFLDVLCALLLVLGAGTYWKAYMTPRSPPEAHQTESASTSEDDAFVVVG